MRANAAGYGGGGRRVHFGHGVGGEGAVDFEDLFGQMFGGGGGFGPIPGADQEAELELALEEAYQGGKRTLRLDGRQYDVDIPAGVLDGQRIRLAGQGGRGNGDAPPGDLLPRGADQTAFTVPRAGSGHLRRSARIAMGGGSRVDSRRSHTGRRGESQSGAWLFDW